MKKILFHINNRLKLIILEIQEFALFIVRVIRSLFRKPRYWQDLFDYMDTMGVRSIPIVLIAGGCFGAIIATEVLFQLRVYGGQFLLGRVTGISVVRGAGPVLTAMIFSSRICSATAAELGAMQVSQQIDALVTMGVDPFRKLITPRIIAGVFMLPALACVNAVTAILSGGLVARSSGEMTISYFLGQSLVGITPGDALWGITKSLVFGLVVVTLACYSGIRVTGGTVGVRKGATQSAVGGILLILVCDFLLTSLGRSF
jgi:phospholipid/cholesterol/gamma-HCH transport system permease protein